MQVLNQNDPKDVCTDKRCLQILGMSLLPCLFRADDEAEAHMARKKKTHQPPSPCTVATSEACSGTASIIHMWTHSCTSNPEPTPRIEPDVVWLPFTILANPVVPADLVMDWVHMARSPGLRSR
jgi:hypothetical protein